MEHFEIIYAGHKLEDVPKHLVNLLPTEKNDIKTANKILEASDKDLEPLLKYLIIWMQDLNWPVTQVIAPRLAALGTKLEPVLKPVFKTDDHIWKYWILTQLVDVKNLSLARALKNELIILTKIKEPEGVANVAQNILIKLNQ